MGYVAEHSTEVSQVTTVADGLFATGEMVSKELADDLAEFSVINNRKQYFLDTPTHMGRLNVAGYAIQERIMKRLGFLVRFAFVGNGQKKLLKGSFQNGIVPPDNLRVFLDRLSVIRKFYKSGSGLLTVIDIVNACANIKAAAVEDRRKVFYQEMAGLTTSAIVGNIGKKLVVAVWKRSPVGGVVTLGLALVSGYHAINQAKEGAGAFFDANKDLLDVRQIDYLIQVCR